MAEEQLGFDIPEEGERKPKRSSRAEPKASGKGDAQGTPEENAGPRKLQDDEIFDFITGDKVVKLTPTEEVRQRIARVLVHQYGIDPQDMEADFPIPVVNQKTGRKSPQARQHRDLRARQGARTPVRPPYRHHQATSQRQPHRLQDPHVRSGQGAGRRGRRPDACGRTAVPLRHVDRRQGPVLHPPQPRAVRGRVPADGELAAW
ncbi:hypothetical protein LT493_34075 [Streptomyces tricolor]|nr:hypothetical protein [Streptomyces tricolor]